MVELSGTPGADVDAIKQLRRGTVQFLAGIELCATAAAAQRAGRRARRRRQSERAQIVRSRRRCEGERLLTTPLVRPSCCPFHTCVLAA